jgi:hypothetical protein
MTPSSSAEDEDSAEERSSCDSCAGLGDKVGPGYPLMDWFSRENLNRKPSIFPLRSWGFTVDFPLNQSIENSNRMQVVQLCTAHILSMANQQLSNILPIDVTAQRKVYTFLLDTFSILLLVGGIPTPLKNHGVRQLG